MANRPRRKIIFFKRRKGLPGEGFPDRPPRKKIPIGQMKKGIFILPSLLTLTSIFFSFYAIICAIAGEFMLSGALILVAAFFDGIDGKVARLTKTTTRFGLELDSLADVISFGVAPAVLMYLWALSPYGRIGWIGAFVFVACGALRLARFNIQSGIVDPKRFTGLPIPAAAVIVATTVLFFSQNRAKPRRLRDAPSCPDLFHFIHDGQFDQISRVQGSHSRKAKAIQLHSRFCFALGAYCSLAPGSSFFHFRGVPDLRTDIDFDIVCSEQKAKQRTPCGDRLTFGRGEIRLKFSAASAATWYSDSASGSIGSLANH